MAPFDRSHTTFYWSAIVNIALSCTVSELFDVYRAYMHTHRAVIRPTLHHSVSVITNFVIPKRDRQTDKKISHFFVYSRRATHDHHHTWHGDRGGPSRFCTPPNFFDPISSFAARGY